MRASRPGCARRPRQGQYAEECECAIDEADIEIPLRHPQVFLQGSPGLSALAEAVGLAWGLPVPECDTQGAAACARQGLRSAVYWFSRLAPAARRLYPSCAFKDVLAASFGEVNKRGWGCTNKRGQADVSVGKGGPGRNFPPGGDERNAVCFAAAHCYGGTNDEDGKEEDQSES
jgi:hypothetical protein